MFSLSTLQDFNSDFEEISKPICFFYRLALRKDADAQPCNAKNITSFFLRILKMTKQEEVFKVKLIRPNATCPKIATRSSAGYDLYAQDEGTIAPGERKKIDLGCSLEIPEGYYGQICSRSGLSFKCGIMAMGGVIDADYRGELSVLLFNSGNTPFSYAMGDRIAQMVLIKVFTEQPVLVNEISCTERSSGGFGSTGK